MLKERGFYFKHLPERSSKSLFRDGFGWWPTVLSGSLVYGYPLMRLILPAKFSFKNLYADLKRVININMDIYCPSNCCRKMSTVNDNCYFYPMQSSIQQSNTEQTDSQEQVQVSFDDQTPGEVVTIPADIESEGAIPGSNVSIQQFLQRPVKIFTYNWNLGATTTSTFNPWLNYFNHASIKKKLDNYFLIRCKLHLKFVINASPFHYGTMLVSYKPLTNYFAAPVDVGMTDDAQNVAYSQLPRIYLYPQTSQGGEVELPFIINREWLDITVASNTTNMGVMDFRPLTPLQFANAGTGVPITIQVFAWAEDVTLSGPTVKLSMQSAMDEYGTGPVSSVASAIAHYTGLLRNAPVIGKFATATSLVSKAVADVSHLFGFTNVPVIDDVHSFTPHPFPQFASPEIGTALEKLTLDPKNELSVDPSIVGLNVPDELLISNIVSRESYITQFPWAISNQPDDILFSTAISPNYIRRSTSLTTMDYIQGTPLFLACRPFSFWKGDIKIRFKFNCSMYHRGRVRISWDPVGDIGATVDTTTEVYTKIIDLAKCTDITINIPYMQDTAFLKVDRAFIQRYSNDGSQANIPGFTNGVLTVRALTDLAAPASTADIQVLVFVSGGDNLDFACPTNIDTTAQLYAYPMQSSIENYDVERDEMEMALKPSIIHPNTYLLYHGEVVKSFRTLLRRTVFQRFLSANSFVLTSANTAYNQKHRIPRIFSYPGYTANAPGQAKGIVTPASTFPFNWVKWTPLNWITQCYLANRGSIIWRANLSTTRDIYNFRATRSNGIDTLTASDYSSGTFSTATSFPDRFNNLLEGAAAGISVTNTKTLTGLNVLAPYYSRYKFRSTARSMNILGSTTDDSDVDWIQFEYKVNPVADSNASTTFSNLGIELYHAAGTDFTPLFFLNVPTLFLYPSVPSSA